MKRLLFALVLLVAPWGAFSAQATPVQTVTTPSGVTAYLLADPTLPIVSLSFILPGGAVSDPADRRGLATLASGLLDEGAGPYDSQAFRARLEDQAIELRFDAGRDSFSGSLKTTTATLEDAFALLRLALHEPRFDAEPVDRIRAQVMTAVRMGEADPQTLASKALFAAVFADSPYAFDEQGSEEGLRAITADDLRGFVRRQLVRQGLAIGVAGDITPEHLSALLERTFGDLPATGDQPPLPVPTPRLAGTTTVIDRDIPQSIALLAQGGLKREDADWQAAYVLNYILGGGGFNSRLMNEVREKRGLAYSVYSTLYPFRTVGLWLAGTATQNARLGESLAVMRAEWARMAESGPTDQELADAKTYLTGAWPLRFTSTEAVAAILASMRMTDLPADYIDRRNAEILALTTDDLRRVAKRLMTPDQLTAVVVGRPEGLPPAADPTAPAVR